MFERAKGTVPLALVIAVLAFLWVEFSLNFTFHWVTNGDLGNGLSLPGNFHLIVAGAFVSWGLFFAAGADMAALNKMVIASIIGSVGALILFYLGPKIADLPDFWGLALTVGILAFVIVLASAAGDWYYVPGIFGGFAVGVLWWIATGLDRWAPGGGGGSNSLAGLKAKPGTGAFGGVISTPAGWVFVDVLVTLLCGCALGWLSVKITGLITPKPRTADATARENATA